MNKRLVVVVLMMLLAIMSVGCLSKKGIINVNVPGEYDLQLSAKTEVDDGITITFVIDSVEVLEDASLKFNVAWGVDINKYDPWYTYSISKGSDEGNTNMFLQDDKGNKYHHFWGEGAAYQEVTLEDGDSVTGAFYFDPMSSDVKHITFHDLDNGKTLGPIGIER